MGYVYNEGVQSKHWMQFADDTAIVTALESDKFSVMVFWNGAAGPG